eukprot:TRINITY_DN41172_c0_g1_i1.p1 TRINITY_DN41172_c0_g1~~TRINITY_DN41172_c0_g1_i1.p1  ORF type:complete len:432 (+),score=78.50 TRINITY_DN41172_c0_g1_i1:63-1358(+)
MSSQGSGQSVWGPHELGYAVHDLALRKSACSSKMLIACSSFIPEASNFVDILSVSLEGKTGVQSSTRLPHYYPPTRVRWVGDDSPELLATSGDCLRVWSASGELCRLLRHDSNPQGRCTPITSVDASQASSASSRALASCDIYGVCAVWDAETGQMQQALDLGQPLADVAFGPERLLAVAGDQGDVFLLDLRQPQDVSVFAPQQRVRGPARIAWGAQRADIFAVAWQGEDGALALYDGSMRHPQVTPKVIKSASGTHTSDLHWSPAYPELLACAQEDGQVQVWQFPEEGLESSAAAASPGYSWAPRGRSANCTALAMSPEVKPGSHAMVVATMPAGQPGPQGQEAAATGGSLWIAALPAPNRRQPAAGGSLGTATAPSVSQAGPQAASGAVGGFARADAAAGASGPSRDEAGGGLGLGGLRTAPTTVLRSH